MPVPENKKQKRKLKWMIAFICIKIYTDQGKYSVALKLLRS